MREGPFRSFGVALLLTIVGFVAGLAAGIWKERHRPMPPPPAQFLAEFAGAVGSSVHGPADRAELAAAIEKVRPQIGEYRERMDAIDQEFDRDIEAVLGAEQRERYEEKVRKHLRDREEEAAAAAAAPEALARAQSPSDIPKGSRRLTDQEVVRYLQYPFKTLVQTVILQLRLDSLTRDFKLDDGQRARVRDLLRVRREKFIELVDSVPPPSVSLSRLAPVAQRLAPGEPAPAAPAAP